MRRVKFIKRVSVRSNAVMNDLMKYNLYSFEGKHLEDHLEAQSKTGLVTCKITAWNCLQFKSIFS